MTFVDYYEMLQISPNAQIDTINRVYRLLAQRFHPDNPESADTERFLKLQSAYAVLSNSEKKMEYDEDRRRYYDRPMEVFGMKEFTDGIDAEAKIRIGVLCLLYSKRRANPDFAALSLLDMENIMAFPRERLLFALWYLRSKRYVVQDDRSSFIISADGVDFLESQLPTNQILYKIYRASESGVMVYPKALTSKTA